MYDKHLAFGKILNIDIAEGQYKGRYVSIIKNYDSSLNILFIAQPRLADIFIPLNKSDKLTVRFMVGSMPCLYNSEVIDSIAAPDGIIFKITGPNKVSKNDRRKYLRIPTPPIPVIYSFEDKPLLQSKAALIDISYGGLNIEVFKPHKTGDKLALNFNLSNKKGDIITINSLAVSVVWQAKVANRSFLGLKFGRFKINQETNLRNYIIFLQQTANWEKYTKRIIGDDI